MEKFCKIKELYRLIYEIETTIQEKHQLSVNECMVLCAISKGNITAGQLSLALTQSKSRMSKILNEMVHKDLINRKSHETDKRITQFSLTEQGLEKYKEIKNIDINIPDIQINCI